MLKAWDRPLALLVGTGNGEKAACTLAALRSEQPIIVATLSSMVSGFFRVSALLPAWRKNKP
jgi:hypothetical protein